ncbi:hypothetical protein ACIGBL_33460 [Streptomyces sp. NPDC085614]|uniref:hypothetical protein n=1 Tax=Streptomyces sp. NPDC085614 TaxID=3365733 RepID=UPI0037D949A0
MTLNAQHWVWNHSRTKGNPRLVVLAVADKAPDAQCTTRMGTTEFRARLGGVSKSVVVRAVDAALASGDLVMIEESRGSIAAKYQLPHAVGYVKPAPGARGTESGPVAATEGSQIGTPTDTEGSQIGTGSDTARGTESGPGGSQIGTDTGPESGPLYQTTPTRSGSKPESDPEPAASIVIPALARDLVDTISRAGYDTLRWNLKPNDWLIVHALIKSHGTERLARYAIEQCGQRQITYGTYFLPGWRDLPPAPAPDPDGVHRLPALRPAPTPASSPQTARRNASRNVLDQLAEQLRAGGPA